MPGKRAAKLVLHRVRALSGGPLAALFLLSASAIAQPRDAASLSELSLEELANVEITSVSRRPERLLDAPASIYVITNDDIRRAGVTTLPEALRLAPNLQVARVTAYDYAISARGFNNAIGNKLLVLIDGRTVYTPAFSGVFWDMQDVLLEDVERIEVISGPGGTLWGANAFNGVINIITRASSQTQGSMLMLGSGNVEQDAAFRYGGTLANGATYRVYGKGQQGQNTHTANGTSVPDGWGRAQVGFRSDWRDGADGFTVQGDGYSGKAEPRGVAGPLESKGMNLLARWTRAFDGGSELKVQTYLDHSHRKGQLLFQPEQDIFDFDFQHAIPLGAQRLLWGGGYRHARDHVKPGLFNQNIPGIFAGMIPQSRELEWANLFVQDEIRLTEQLDFTAGVKLESNDYTGVEYLPSMRLAWKPAAEHLVWSALSRAVRAPARLDRDFRLAVQPPVPIILGGPNFESEIVDVLEVGYRTQLGRTASFSITAAHHEFDRLRSGQLPPALIQNMMQGKADIIEGWAAWQVLPSWRLSAGFMTLSQDIRLQPGSNDPTGPSAQGNDPDYQWSVRSAHNLPHRQEVDVIVRRVGTLPNPVVPDYTALDLRYAWRMAPGLELSVTATNAGERWHPEFNAAPGRSEIERSVFFALRWSS